MPSSTFCKWGTIIQNESDDKIIEALSATSGNGKITPEINQFVRTQFHEIYPKNSYSYSKEIRRKIKEAFDVSVSGECLRPIFNAELKRHEADKPLLEESVLNNNNTSTPSQIEHSKEEDVSNYVCDAELFNANDH